MVKRLFKAFLGNRTVHSWRPLLETKKLTSATRGQDPSLNLPTAIRVTANRRSLGSEPLTAF